MAKRLTYRLLFERLRKLGYRPRNVQLNGKEQVILEHTENPAATIYLARRPLDDEVLPLHVGIVQATLTTHGILQVDPRQVLFHLLEDNAIDHAESK
jgi:hypothetical protein